VSFVFRARSELILKEEMKYDFDIKEFNTLGTETIAH
jgi:hypothetical protein